MVFFGVCMLVGVGFVLLLVDVCFLLVMKLPIEPMTERTAFLSFNFVSTSFSI